MRYVVARLSGGLGAVLLTIAGLGKLVAIDEFAKDLETWTIVPKFAIPLLAVVVSSGEFGVGVLWLGRATRRTGAWIGLGLALLLLSATVMQWVVREPPSCSCFGVLARYMRFESTAVKVIVLNAGLVSCFGLWLWVNRHGRTNAELEAAVTPGF